MHRLSHALRPLLVIVIAACSLLGLPAGSPDVAQAAPAEARGKEKESAARPSGDYLEQLLGEINRHRAHAGTRPLAIAPTRANRAVDQYLADLTPVMLAYGACFHGDYNPVPPGWDYVTAAGLGGDALGEVLACPDDSGYWTPARIAQSWWESPIHQQAIYDDPDANVVACGAFGPRRGGQAYVTIACVTFRI
ncbi:MAG: hypothetical protein IT306_21225 [Chloroflexi bacterium]|nr:hypothetical protein [Chloroflexota bacterium]